MQTTFSFQSLKLFGFGLLTTLLFSFVSGFGLSLIDPPMLLPLAFLYTAALSMAFLLGAIPFCFIAKPRRPRHAGWIAVAACILSYVSLFTGLSAFFARFTRLVSGVDDVYEPFVADSGLHFVLLSVVCMAYRIFWRERLHEDV